MDRLADQFASRNITLHRAADAGDAVGKALAMIPAGSSVGFGGSVTLEQTGILDKLRARDDVELIDRDLAGSPEEMRELYLGMFGCDVFLTGSNAITEDGRIVNVDGRGNRVAMIAYGPRKVIVLAGRNKLTAGIGEALERIRETAVPLNLERIRSMAGKSPVAPRAEITAKSIWGQVSIIERQIDPERMHLILIDEDLGF